MLSFRIKKLLKWWDTEDGSEAQPIMGQIYQIHLENNNNNNNTINNNDNER